MGLDQNPVLPGGVGLGGEGCFGLGEADDEFGVPGCEVDLRVAKVMSRPSWSYWWVSQFRLAVASDQVRPAGAVTPARFL